MRRTGRGFALFSMVLVVGVCGSFELPQKPGKQVGPVAAMFQVTQNQVTCFRPRYTVGLPFAFALARRFARCVRRQRDTLASYD